MLAQASEFVSDNQTEDLINPAASWFGLITHTQQIISHSARQTDNVVITNLKTFKL